MTAKTAYSFLKPSIGQLSQYERQELCRLILGRKKKKKPVDNIMSVTEMKKRLLKSHFKS